MVVEITQMLTALKKKFIVSFITIFGTISFRVPAYLSHPPVPLIMMMITIAVINR